jgi:hypothetical protein
MIEARHAARLEALRASEAAAEEVAEPAPVEAGTAAGE